MNRKRIVIFGCNPEAVGQNALRSSSLWAWFRPGVCGHFEATASETNAGKPSQASKRKHAEQMRRLTNRIWLNVLICLGVLLCWATNLVTLAFLLIVCFLCGCVVAYNLGVGCEKIRIGGEKT